MVHLLADLQGAWRIVAAKPKQVQRLVLPPFLLALALKAWISVQLTGQALPDLPPSVPVTLDLAIRAGLGLALAIMGLLWHRAIYFGPRAPLTASLALRYWGQGAVLSLLALLPFLPLAAAMVGPGLTGAALPAAVFAADAVSLWLVLVFGVVVARAAGGAAFGWRAALAQAQALSALAMAVGLALLLALQTIAVAALSYLHGGAAFLLDGAITFALVVAVLTLMARPGT
jgi:hypothetical protein